MENSLDKIEVNSEYKHFQIREIKPDGGYHRRVLICNRPLADDEHQEIKDKAGVLWTDEVKAAYEAHLAESTP